MELTSEQLYDVKFCVMQWFEDHPNNLSEFCVVSVWFPEPANLILGANCADDEYHVRIKTRRDFTHAEVLSHLMSIWNNEFLPVEVIQTSESLYYGIQKEIIKMKLY